MALTPADGAEKTRSNPVCIEVYWRAYRFTDEFLKPVSFEAKTCLKESLETARSTSTYSQYPEKRRNAF